MRFRWGSQAECSRPCTHGVVEWRFGARGAGVVPNNAALSQLASVFEKEAYLAFAVGTQSA